MQTYGMIYKLACGLLLSAILSLRTATAAEDWQQFVPGSLKQILAARSGQPLLLVLWSVDCPPCVSELSVLARVRREHPGMEIVFVATDDVSRAHEAQDMLAKHGLGHYDSWIFADPNAQRLRFEIDPQWYGELPRSYFYDHAHQRVGFSGKLRDEHLKQWATLIKAQANPRS
jgi:hypothetical protein